MKDFAKSIVCNTKAEAEKVGNFEDPKDAKRYIQMWERRKQDAKSWIDDANRKLRELHKDHGGAFGSLSESEKRSHKAEAQRHEDTIRKYQAEFEKYDNLIKQAQKSTWGNTKAGNAVPGIWVKKSAMDGPIQEKEFNGYSLVVQEDTDGKKKWWSWYVYKGNSEIAGGEESSEGSAKARAEHWLEHSVPMPTNRTGNSKTGNSYNWEERRGHQELYDPTVPFGGHVRGYVEKTKNGYVGAKTNGSIIISQKEFATEAEAKKFVENKQTGNSKVGNGITKFGLGKYVVADGYKAIVLGEKEERGPNGIPFGWVTIRWVEGPWKGQSDQYYDYDLKKTGNKKVGNANTHLTASNSGELWLNFDGTGEMYDPIELGRYDFSGKSEALSVARELEQLKRKAEQKVKDADKFINAIKQWAAGLK